MDVCEPGDYRLELTYKGEGRMTWRIETGKHTIAVSLVEGDREKASLHAVQLSPAE